MVLNIDDPLVNKMRLRSRARVVTFGRSEEADMRLLSTEFIWPPRLRLEVSWRGERFLVESALIGEHWSVSLLAALTVSLELGVNRDDALALIAAFKPGYNRMSFHETPDLRHFVLDAMKAPHWGLARCLSFLKDFEAPRKTVVFGTISYYHGNSGIRYEEAAKWALEVADRVIMVGSSSSKAKRLRDSQWGHRIHEVTTIEAAHSFLNRYRLENEVIYLKSSSADHLERLFHACFAEISCWEDRCGKTIGCIHCSQLVGKRIKTGKGFSTLPWLDDKDARPV